VDKAPSHPAPKAKLLPACEWADSKVLETFSKDLVNRMSHQSMGNFSEICACQAHLYRINHGTHTPAHMHTQCNDTHTQPELAMQAEEGEREGKDDGGTNSQKSVDIVFE
jgi:hypothetical protein